MKIRLLVTTFVILIISGCSSVRTGILVQLADGSKPLKGEAVASLSSGTFQASNGSGLVCDGTYNQFSQSTQLKTKVKCNDGRHGEVIVSRHGKNLMNGTGTGKLNDGTAFKVILGSMWVNPKQPLGNKRTVAKDKASSQCKKESYAKVPQPARTDTYVSNSYQPPKEYGIYNSYGSRVGTLRPEDSYGYGAAPNYGSFVKGYNEARARRLNSPSAIYNRAIKNYYIACMNSKGWSKKEL